MVLKNCLIMLAIAAWLPLSAEAGDIRISLPKGSKITPVQQLNRDGVEALRKNKFEKAKALFYRAYLFDPNDPFTLNNLGYISELDGQVDRAHRFYELAAKNQTDAVIDRASARNVEGQTVAQVAGNVQDKTMQVNRDNVEAIRLLSQGRAPEADLLLRRTLALEPGNPFSLNNYAVAKEMEGDYEEALKFYTAAARTGSSQPVIVTLNQTWRGKSVSELAEDGARKVQERMQQEQSLAAQVNRLNLQGVSAINRNSLYDARHYFERAYKLSPDNAFVLNNRGYLAEMDGDSETAEVFYQKARRSSDANARVGYATRQGAEGRKLFEVAETNDQKMQERMTQVRDLRRRATGPVRLKRRDNTPVTHTEPPQAAPAPQNPNLGPPQPPVLELNRTPRP